jgi:predicted nucleic acid-binding protein
MRPLVLDTNALVAYLTDFSKVSQRKVRGLLKTAKSSGRPVLLGVVHWGELHYVLGRSMGWETCLRTLPTLEAFPITVVPLDPSTARRAARLKMQKGLPFADCLAAALALEHNADLVTGDRDFQRVENEVKIVWI